MAGDARREPAVTVPVTAPATVSAAVPVSLPRVGSFVAVTVAAGLAGSAFHRAFAVGALAGPVALAAVIPVIAVATLAGMTRRRRVPLLVSVLVWAGLWLAVVAMTLFRHGSPDAPAVLPAVGDGLLNGWVRLLEVTLPAPDSPDLVVVPQALTWLAAGAGAELVARTRTTLLPIVPAVVVFAAGVTLTVPGPGSNLLVAAGLVVAAGLLTLCRHAEARPATTAGGHAGRRGVSRGGSRARTGSASASGSFPGRAMIGLSVAVVVAAAAVFVGPLLPPVHGRGPYDVRTERAVSLYPMSTVSPLDEVAAWLGSPGRRLFTVRTSGHVPASTPAPAPAPASAPASASAPAPANIRLAVLDRFDGQSWTSSARFSPAGRRVPPRSGELARTGEIRQDVEIDGLDGALIPAMDRPVQLDGTGLAVDVASGALLSTVPLQPGRRYTVTSAPQTTPDQAVLVSLRPAAGADADAARYLPPGLPDLVREAAREASAGAGTPFQQAYALEQYLRTNFTYDPTAPAGHTYGHLNYFLTKNSGTGTSEQFATVFAVAARTLGLPSRVVVGFTLPGGPANTANDTLDVHTGDVLVWPEIDFAGVGWLPFYPTPKQGQRSGGKVASSAQGESTDREQRVGAAAAVPVQQATPLPPAPPPAHHTPLSVYAGLVFGGVVIAVVVGYLAVAVGAPVARRRRRRSARTSRERVVGAWHSMIDMLAGAGIAIPAASTPVEMVGLAPAAIGDSGRESLLTLANLVTTALFAADGTTIAEADAAWFHEKHLRTRLRRAVPAHRRMMGRLAPSRVVRGGRHR